MTILNKKMRKDEQMHNKNDMKKRLVMVAMVCLMTGFVLAASQKSKDIIPLATSSDKVTAQYISETYLNQVWKPLDEIAQMTICYAALSESDIFTYPGGSEGTNVTLMVKGEVTDIKHLEIDYADGPDSKKYGAIVEILVEKVYRGDCKEKQKIKALLNYTLMCETDALCGLEVGDRGIFMPEKYTEESIWWNRIPENFLSLGDLSDSGFGSASMYVFMETEEGMRFERWRYPDIKDATTFEEVEEYIIRMAQLYPAEKK